MGRYLFPPPLKRAVRSLFQPSGSERVCYAAPSAWTSLRRDGGQSLSTSETAAEVVTPSNQTTAEHKTRSLAAKQGRKWLLWSCDSSFTPDSVQLCDSSRLFQVKTVSSTRCTGAQEDFFPFANIVKEAAVFLQYLWCASTRLLTLSSQHLYRQMSQITISAQICPEYDNICSLKNTFLFLNAIFSFCGAQEALLMANGS